MHFSFGALALMTIFALWLGIPTAACLLAWLEDKIDNLHYRRKY